MVEERGIDEYFKVLSRDCDDCCHKHKTKEEAIACASNLISENKGINPMWVWCSVWRISRSEKGCWSEGDRVWQHGVGFLEKVNGGLCE